MYEKQHATLDRNVNHLLSCLFNYKNGLQILNTLNIIISPACEIGGICVQRLKRAMHRSAYVHRVAETLEKRTTSFEVKSSENYLWSAAIPTI